MPPNAAGSGSTFGAYEIVAPLGAGGTREAHERAAVAALVAAVRLIDGEERRVRTWLVLSGLPTGQTLASFRLRLSTLGRTQSHRDAGRVVAPAQEVSRDDAAHHRRESWSLQSHGAEALRH
jgi:hypothetical protein